jgi:glucan 1,3-beta-glucosidase
MLHTEGTRWLTADGQQPALRGVNLGNYLIQEFWMMGQETKAVDDQCKLEAVLDRASAMPSGSACMGCFAITGSRRATGTAAAS